MTADPVSFVVGLIGGVVGVGVGVLGAYAFFRDRQPSLSVTTLLTGDERDGNDITLLNASKTPASVYHYDLVWAKRGYLGKNIAVGRRLVETEFSLGPDRCEFTVPANGQHTLNFNEDDHFAWGGMIKNDLYIRLWMVGRRQPLWLWVTGPRDA